MSAGDVLVLNDSRVFPARLIGQKPTGAMAEVLLIEPLDEDGRRWRALVRPGGKLKPGRVVEVSAELSIEIEAGREEGERVVRLLTALEPRKAVERWGHVPAATLHPTGGRRSRPCSIPDGLRSRSGKRGGPDGGAPLQSAAVGSRPRAGRRVGAGHPACRTRHLSPRRRIGSGGSPPWGRAVPRIGGVRGDHQRGARAGRVGVGRRDDDGADAGIGRACGWSRGARRRGDRTVHPARIRVSRCRSADHQLPPAALDPADAGGGVCRP